MDFSKERKIIGGFASLLAILILLGSYSYYNNKKSSESNLYVMHTNDVLQHLGQVRNALFDLETSQATFLVSKNEESIQESLIARKSLFESFQTLKVLKNGNSLQQARIDTLERLLKEKLAYSDSLFGQTNQSIALSPLQINRLRQKELLATRQMIHVINRFRLLERELRETNKGMFDSYIDKFNLVIILLFLLAFTCIIFVFISVFYHLRTQKANENVVRQSWQTLQSILDNTSSYISIKDLQGRYTLVNKQFEFDETHNKDSFLGKTDDEVFSIEVGKITKATDDKVVQEGNPIQYTSQVNVGGKPRHYFVVKFPLKDIHDTIIGVTAISTDITEQVNLEEEKRKALESVYDLYNKAPCGYHSVDENGTISEMNDTELKWLGYTREEVIGKIKFSDLVYKEQTSNYLQHIEQRTGNNSELYITRKDGTNFPVILSTEAILDEQKNFIKSRTIVFNNTERKKQEDRIKQLNLDLEINNVLLKATNSELESFTYSVSHDLRAPLRSINGYSQILLEDHTSQLDEDGKKTISIIMKNAKRMGQLIDDLLAFSRMGRQDLKKGKVDIQELVKNVLQDLPAHKADLKVDYLPIVKADHNLLRQVWHNLISNAIKYSGPKNYPEIQIGYRQELMEDIFFIKDNGVGFDMQYAHKLFGVFQRLHRNDEFEGTGVGLAFVQRIIAKHGGKVWAESVLNEGTVFYFSLPRLDLNYLEHN